MKDILIKYPLPVLRKELINVRTGYRLEKQKLIEILKSLKAINKLSKDEVIELLIKYNYDISKLPKEISNLPKRLDKYNKLDIDEINNLFSTGKIEVVERDILKYLYKNNEDFRKYADDTIDFYNKTKLISKIKDYIKFKTEKTKVDDLMSFYNTRGYNKSKSAYFIAQDYFPNIYYNIANFSVKTLEEIAKKNDKQIDDYPDLKEFISKLRSYKVMKTS